MRVFQSVSLSLKRHVVTPPFEMFVHGFVVPGNLAITHPDGIGIRQLCRFSFFPMPKLQDDSVVADESPRGCAGARPNKKRATIPADNNTRIFIMPSHFPMLAMAYLSILPLTALADPDR
jgi:hypothetical protein